MTLKAQQNEQWVLALMDPQAFLFSFESCPDSGSSDTHYVTVMVGVDGVQIGYPVSWVSEYCPQESDRYPTYHTDSVSESQQEVDDVQRTF